MTKRISVCVVGAGPAGLCAARHLAADPATFTFDVYELGADIGGLWVYTDEVGVGADGLPIHSSMYRSLHTNFLQEIMGFPDFPFPEAPGSSYPSHAEVLQYLHNYAAHFDLYKHIRLRHQVKVVDPVPGKHAGDERWSVTVWDAEARREITKVYDAVAVCSGTNCTPDIPDIAGIELFRGETMHCHDYRSPEKFKGLRVAVLGASFSGKDVAMETSRVATEVHLCHSLDPITSKFPANVIESPTIVSANATGFVLKDGTTIQADIIVYCTGYKYNYPFLSRRCGINIQGKRVRPLYKHMINIEKPTLGLIGVPSVAIPILMSHHQLIFFLATLKDPSKLPSKEEMYADEERETEIRLAKGCPPRHCHKMVDFQWDYYESIDAVSGARPPPHYLRKLWTQNFDRLSEDFAHFRSDAYGAIVKNLAAAEAPSKRA